MTSHEEQDGKPRRGRRKAAELTPKQRALLSAFLPALPEKNRVVAEMTLKGIEQRDIAKALGKTQPAVSSMLKNTLAAVERLGRDLDGTQ